jgi:hypothetical protein
VDSQSAFLFDTQSNLVLADQSRTRELDVLQPVLAQTAVARTHPRSLADFQFVLLSTKRALSLGASWRSCRAVLSA